MLRTYIFRNIEPTMAVIESLGFQLVNEHPLIFTKTMGGRVCRLGLFWETAGWDISDNTWLEFRYDDTKFANTVHSSLIFPDGFYMGTHKVPTAEQITPAICYLFERTKKTAFDNLNNAYKEYQKVEDLVWS